MEYGLWEKKILENEKRKTYTNNLFFRTLFFWCSGKVVPWWQWDTEFYSFNLFFWRSGWHYGESVTTDKRNFKFLKSFYHFFIAHFIWNNKCLDVFLLRDVYQNKFLTSTHETVSAYTSIGSLKICEIHIDVFLWNSNKI